MFDLADSLIGKANQIEVSCHISFFSELKKQKSQHSLAIRIARAAGSKLSSSFPPPLERFALLDLASDHARSRLDDGGGYLRGDKYHTRTVCQDISAQDFIERCFRTDLRQNSSVELGLRTDLDWIAGEVTGDTG
jgi:hypothetical protein